MAEELEAIQRMCDLLSWTLDRVESFSKPYRVPLGDRMQDTMCGALDVLVDAEYTSGSVEISALTRTNGLLERLRFQGRLACEKQCICRDQHGHFTKLVNAAEPPAGQPQGLPQRSLG